ncbi:mitochondrial 54S ribosomal protein YmL35 [Coemansia thaxteri]|uniref:Mitochondrial 54S ribosomal protein YmL35 n=1 Tax=Coemansia thaxteri TaxID=2663907 RepID=A0A9W8EGW2_9FUNG|nr:mitochondrial 54S ribosomal protein YmL35 [Coemansia thaxteri]KAJ2004504.1 mitochondrial 54S ribosomal protein YmL35 [Coemansia thaxteri]KAJ2465663.1 mitochondrial 54S ribosomal protein YmL35 [Coemansia sp. RSA 2322]KAJ2473286.1 mitochondrial 54S ribosomal protein YmL35 [Coemansia sp. RSA 2320]
MNAARSALTLARFGRKAAGVPPQFRLLRQQSTYARPAAGVNPAYDESVKLIDAYATKKRAEAELAAKELAQAEGSGASCEHVSALKKKWFDLAVEADINDSEVLWNAKNGLFDLTRPVYLHLKEQAWRGRPLEILMQRLLQMYVLPDLLDPRDVGTPEAQLNLTLSGSPDLILEPGSIISPSDAREQLEIELVKFHEDSRLHTLVMVDLDEPLEAQQTFREQFHWVVANLPFSKSQSKANTADGLVLLPYIPPHPARGTPAHRYAVVLFEQGEGGLKRLEATNVSRDSVLRNFVAQHGLRPAGISFFRASWTEAVDDIYRDVLKQTPPNYGVPPTLRSDIGPDGRKINVYKNY